MSIEALNWARKIYVGDSLAKSLLRGIADYADENGRAWPSHGRLASDCEMSESTVKRKIAWLEERGVLVTLRCWIDDRGVRNHNQTGRETSRDIILALDKRIVAPVAESGGGDDGDGEGGGSHSTPSIGNEGVQADPPGGSQLDHPGGSLVTTLNEPSLNQEDSPQAPQAGGGEPDIDPEVRRRFDYFFTSCHGYRAQPSERPFEMFRLLSEAEQTACAAASPVHAAELTKLRKKSRDAWKLIRDRFWTAYPDARLPAPPPVLHWISEPADLAALQALAAITDRPMPRLVNDAERGQGLWRNGRLGADLQALAATVDDDQLDWEVVAPETREYRAWRARLHEWTGIWIEPRIVMRRGTHKLEMLPGQPPRDVQNRTSGIPVPWLWPPKKDGSTYGNLNHDDAQALADEGRTS